MNTYVADATANSGIKRTDNTSIYVPHKRKANESDSVWFYFLTEKNNGQTAKCRRCEAILKTKGGSTKGLITHLKVHKIDLLDKRLKKESQDASNAGTSKLVVGNTNNPLNKQKKIIDFLVLKKNDNSFEAVVARMTAVDGLPFSIFIKSPDLRQMLEARGYHVPKSRHTIKTLVIAYFEKIRNSVVDEIHQLKTNGEKFSLTFDEWTSISNKHFMSINVHKGEKFWNLGLVRLKHSLTATACVDHLEKRLQAFQLNMTKDIVAVTTDGASTMVKVGKLITPMQQLCFAHGIQLAVIDVLYKKDVPTSGTYAKEVLDTLEFSDSDADSDCEESENMETMDRIEVCENNDFLEITNERDLHIMISKIRKTVRMFRKSPMKNDLLQKQIRSDHGKELKLILDSKTRWSSLLDMLDRFTLLENSIKKALIDLNMLPILDSEWQTIKGVVKVLQPIKLTVEALCRRDMDLYKADAALKFMLEELAKIKTTLSNDLQDSLRNRIKQRRTIYSETLSYLTDPDFIKSEPDDCFKTSNIFLIKSELEKILIRLNNEDATERESTDESDEDEIPIAEILRAENESLEVKLQKALQKCLKPIRKQTRKCNQSRLSDTITQEIHLYANGGSRGRNLQQAFEFLSTIQPTSVEPERCFSSAGFLCNKIRSRLGDGTLDALIFLRYFFKNL